MRRVGHFSAILTPQTTCAPAIFSVAEVGDSPKLGVRYGSLVIENGQTLSPEQLVDAPDIDISPANQTSSFTLVVVDPDQPSPHAPKQRSWLHWLVRTRVAELPAGASCARAPRARRLPSCACL